MINSGYGPRAMMAHTRAGSLIVGGKRKATVPRTRCKVYGEVPYRQASACKSSKAAPATNHIVACPVCPSSPMKQYFWSYNMPTHWRRAHSQQPMPPALCQEIEVSTEELARLETLKQPKLSSESGRSASSARARRQRPPSLRAWPSRRRRNLLAVGTE